MNDSSKALKPVKFTPTTKEWRIYHCDRLNLPYPAHMSIRLPKAEIYRPSMLELNLANGDCLFRALSREITGLEDQHPQIRAIVVQYMRTHADKLLTFINVPAEDYLTEMAQEQTWGTDIELAAVATLFQTSIFVYSKYNKVEASFQEFRPMFVESDVTTTDEAIYLCLLQSHFERILA